MKKKTLFLANGLHFPPDSGYTIRVYNLVKCYAEFSDVNLIVVSLLCDDINKTAKHFLNFTSSFSFVNSIDNSIEKKSKKFFSKVLCSYKPKIVQHLEIDRISNLYNEAISTLGPFDYVHADRLEMAEIVLKSTKLRNSRTKYILDLDDWESNKRLLEISSKYGNNFLRNYKRLIDPLRLRLYEKRILKYFDYVYVSSLNDVQKMRSTLNLKNVVNIPNGYSLSKESSKQKVYNSSEKDVILFVGTMSYGPNIDAIDFFVNEIFSHLTFSDKKREFLIVGTNPPNNVCDLGKQHPEIKVLGFVPDLSQLYAISNIVVVPIRYGGGTRIKILEAAAFEKPVVSTSIGAEGLKFVDKRDILIEDDPVRFASACSLLLNDRLYSERLGKNAFETYKNNYTWRVVEKQIRKLLTQPGEAGTKQA